MEKVKILLDTSAYSTFLAGNREMKEIIQHAEEIVLNPVVLGELFSGFSLGTKEKQNKEILYEFLSSERIRILDIDFETSLRYAVILKYLYSQGTPIPTNDMWIASSAMQYGLKVITFDNHYSKIPQIIAQILHY